MYAASQHLSLIETSTEKLEALRETELVVWTVNVNDFWSYCAALASAWSVNFGDWPSNVIRLGSY